MKCFLMAERFSRALAGRLDDSQAIEVEQHLQGCSQCRKEQELLRVLTAPAREYEPALSASAAARIAEAVANTPVAASRPQRARKAPVLIGAMAVVAALVVLRFGVPALDQPAPTVAVAPPAKPIEAPRTAQLPATADTPPAMSSVVIGPATVQATPETHFDVAQRQAGIRLRQGDVTVEVVTGHPFYVATPQFTARVRGTLFHVDLRGVTVERGRVTVERRGREVATLTAGDTWTLASERANVAKLFSEARARVEAADGPGANSLLDRLRGLPLSTSEETELALLGAETLLIQRRYQEAARAYHAIAQSRGSAAETALYAAARLEAETLRRPADARRSLDELLRRYPNGRFVNEAQALVRKLEK